MKEKTIGVECGEGVQRIFWLAHVAMARYDPSFGIELGKNDLERNLSDLIERCSKGNSN